VGPARPPAGRSSPMPSTQALPKTDKIAYVVARGGDDFIYTMYSDGSNKTELTNCGPGECYPSWSPTARSSPSKPSTTAPEFM
jgi:Tol biopolymer transport system component